MFAKPNVLNKILPCYKQLNMDYRHSSGAYIDIRHVIGYKLDPDANEYLALSSNILNDFKVGSDVKIIMNGSPIVNIPGEADLYVYFTPFYNYGRDGDVWGADVAGEGVSIKLDAGELKDTIHRTEVIRIPNLQVGDFLCVILIRKGDDDIDTYTDDWLLTCPAILQYEVDKIGTLS